MARSSGRTSRALGWVRCKRRWVLVRSWSAMPAVKTGTVFITNGGDVVAIDHLTGVQRWRFTPADFSPVTNTPAVGPGVVYVTGGNSVFALNATNGHLLWRANLGPQT